MVDKKSATAPKRSDSEVLHHGDRSIASVVEYGDVLEASPASGFGMEDPGDRSLYYRVVLKHVHDRALDTGRILDVHDADPDRLFEFLTERSWRPLDDGRAGRESSLTIGEPEEDLEGEIRFLGAEGLLRPRFYQAVLGEGDGASCLTMPERRSWVGSLPTRVAPLKTALLIGLGETNVELARGLRRLGLRVLLAQAMGAEDREVFTDLYDGGFPVFEVEGSEELRDALGPYGDPDIVIQGPGSDTETTPEGDARETTLEVKNRELADALEVYETLTLDDVPADLRVTGPSTLPLPEAACLEFLLPVLESDTKQGGVEAGFELTLPTTVPFGQKNRHSTDDVSFKAARGLERDLIANLEKFDDELPSCLKDVTNAATGRSRALTVRQQLGPWTVHLAGVLSVRAQKAGGGYVQAEDYERLLRENGEVRVLPRPVDDGDTQALLDGTYLQNIIFSKLGGVHIYRPAAVVAPLTDETFQVFFLAPQISYGVVGQLRAALAASGLAGENGDVRRLADEALGLPRIDARVRYSFPDGGGLPRMEERPELPDVESEDPISSLLEIAGEIAPPSAAPDPEEISGQSDGRVEEAGELTLHYSGETCIVASEGKAAVEVRESDGGHTVHTSPVDGLDVETPEGRAFYLATFLEYLHHTAIDRGSILRVYEESAGEIKRLLAARMMDFTPDEDTPGRASAPVAFGSLRGTRYRLGGERVPEQDRVVQVDLYWADDESDDPRSITLALGSGAEDPIVAMPTTVQVVFGFGNICGDLGVLERRLGYRVAAFNRSPNERALNALENGVPLYEFDETFDEQGERVTGDAQREAFDKAGLRLSGKLRELLDEGLVVGETDGGTPVRACTGHILDGLLGTVRHPGTGESVKSSELYKELLFDHYEERGVPTIYNGSNSPEKVADGRIFIHDAFTTYGIEPVEHYDEQDGPHGSLMCVSCNTTNITGVLLRLTDVPDISELKLRVMTHRKANDQYVGEGKQTVNYQGMAFDFHYHHWSDAKLFYDRIKDPEVRRRLDNTFAYDEGRNGSGPEWAISTHATGQAATEFHTGVIHVSGKLRGEPLDAEELKRELTRTMSDSAQLIEFPGKVDARKLLETLHFRIGIRNLYVQPFTVTQDGDDLAIVFFTPHLYNVKPNNLVAALNRDGLTPNTLAGVETGTAIVGEALGLDRQQTSLARYYGTEMEESLAAAQPIYFFSQEEVEGMAIGSRDERKALLGGKGSGMTEMASITYRDPISDEEMGLPVPPGYTITTLQATRYFENGNQLPQDLVEAVDEYQERLEAAAGKKLGDTEDPLLVSVRSGAAISMPGMMDTILNLGLNQQTVEGLARKSGDKRFAWDCYLRFTEQFSIIALGVSEEDYLKPIKDALFQRRSVKDVSELSLDDLEHLTWEYQHAVLEATGQQFPQDVHDQLFAAIEAVFSSSFSERAVFYRRVNKVPETVVSAVSVVAMVFGNLGDDCATGVTFTRDPLTGADVFKGEYLTNAQGEDVVAGIRAGEEIEEMGNDPKLEDAYRQLCAAQEALERHFRDAQDVEFTIERGKLYILQTRDLGGRTGRAALRIATDMVEAEFISPEEAILKYGNPNGLNELLQPTFDPIEQQKAREDGRLLTKGIAASSGAAVGEIAIQSRQAETLARHGRSVILVRHETSPEDVSGLHGAQGVLTARGGVVSHAAIVARGMGKPAVVGAGDVEIDERSGVTVIGEEELAPGEVISIDGTTGEVFLGELPVVPSPIKAKIAGRSVDAGNEEMYWRFQKLLDWARDHKALQVRCNAETEADLKVALALGAEGLGLARTEHDMLETDERRIAFVALILAHTPEERQKALDAIYPAMEEGAKIIFRLMEGKPATIRLFDPVPNEFLPRSETETAHVAQFMGLSFEDTQRRSGAREETNPMLGLRAVRLYIMAPEIVEAQVGAILTAAAHCKKAGIKVRPQIQIPMVINRAEILRVAEVIHATAKKVMEEEKTDFPYEVGVMVETPSACRVADTYAGDLGFFSFGVNDLTQTVLAISRDDTGHFMSTYEDYDILKTDPFRSLDPIVETFVNEAHRKAKLGNPDIFVFSSGDLGGDPHSVVAFHDMGLDGVSAGPWQVPVSTLAAAQANLKNPRRES